MKKYKIELGHIEYDGKGDLDLEGTSITSLPEGLSVGGYLDLRGTSIIGKYQVVNGKVVKTKANKKGTKR